MPKLPRVCWSVAAATPEEMLACVPRNGGGRRNHAGTSSAVMLVEARLDMLADPALAPKAVSLLRRAHLRVVATLRTAAAGGGFNGTVAEQLALLAECSKAGAELVDLEIESAAQASKDDLDRLRKRTGLLVSSHDYRETPSDLRDVLRRLERFKPDYCKVVATAHTHADAARLLELNRGTGRAVLAFGMGETGMASRVLSLARGAPFTYAAVSPDRRVAPGQIPGRELIERYRAAKLSRKTAVYGVIGNPIAHSISPAVHNAAFAAARLDAVYLPFRVETLADFLAAAPAYGLRGFSVTIPHKEGVFQAAHWVEPAARDVGAINTVVMQGGKLKGYNSDMAGITVPLEKRVRLKGARVLVAGTGGAARAAVFALARAGARVIVTGRRTDQAAALAEQVAGEAIERNDLSDEKFDVIVHATPLGMAPDTESCFFSPGELNAPLLFETVYNPAETRLVALARRRGMKVIPGVEMFLEQALRQFELFTGRKAPRPVMTRAAIEALAPQGPGAGSGGQ